MILGIESSCDESAIALLNEEREILGEWVNSQISKHTEYGGVVPDLAVGEHLRNFIPLLEIANKEYDLNKEISAIAVTCGPGLVGCLGIGISVAKSLGLIWGKTVVGVNHLRGHAFSPFISSGIGTRLAWSEVLPHLGLLVSGGNTLLFELDRDRKLRILAKTVDDAVGEALDKGAKLLGIPYPGGAKLESYAENGSSSAFSFPRAFKNTSEMKFSFSGLKTSLLYTLKKMSKAEISDSFADLCASYQSAAIEQLVSRTQQAIKSGHYQSIGLSGGVANNKKLRTSLLETARSEEISFLPARMQHSGDNASMVAFASLVDEEGLWSNKQQSLSFRPSLGLEELSNHSLKRAELFESI